MKKNVVTCSICSSDKFKYETESKKSIKIVLIGNETVILPVYQDMEYKICCNCGNKHTNFIDN